MSRSVIALFDDRTKAQQARQDLIQHGFAADNVMLTDQPPQTTAQSPGFWERVKEFFGMGEQDMYAEATRRGGTLLSVIAADDDQADRASDLINNYDPVDIDERAETWRQAGWKPAMVSQTGNVTQPPQPAARAPKVPPVQAGEQRIPVVEEQLKVGKRQVRRGVRIFSRVTERPVEEQVQLRDEKVTVERQKTTQPVQGQPFQEKTVEVTEIHEEPVVAKEARVVEEVVVRKETGQHTETVKDTLRRTDVQVEPLEQAFQQDYQTHYAAQGHSWEEYRPAYDYGRQLAMDPRYRGRDWSSIESEARADYERRQPGTWDRTRDAIHRAYDRARGSVSGS